MRKYYHKGGGSLKAIQHLYIALICALLLGNCNGYIALWQDTDPQPLQVYPYRVEMLPEADQQALNRGIPIAGFQELNQLLEDYLS